MKEINYSQSMSRKILIKGNIFTFLENFKPILSNYDEKSVCYLSHVSNNIENMLTWNNFIEKYKSEIKYSYDLDSDNKFYNTRSFVKNLLLSLPANRNKNNYTRIGSIDEMIITSSKDNIDDIKKEFKEYENKTNSKNTYDVLIRKLDNNKYNIFYCYWPYSITNKCNNYHFCESKSDSTNVIIKFVLSDKEEFKTCMNITIKNYIYTDYNPKLAIYVKKYKDTIINKIEKSYFIKISKKILFDNQIILLSKDTGLFIDKFDENYPGLEYCTYGDNEFSLGPIEINFDRTLFHTAKINDGLTGENALLKLIQKDKGEYSIECLKTDKGNKWYGYKL